MPILFLSLYTADAGLHLWACFPPEKHAVRRISKCFLLPLLSVCYVLLAKNFSPLVLAALLCGFAGDAFLLPSDSRPMFAAGLTAFAAGHALYASAMLQSLPRLPSVLAIVLFSVCSVAAAAGFVRYLWSGLPRALIAPCFLYAYLILLMNGCALLFAFAHSAFPGPLAAPGALLFLASDTMLSVHAFRRPVPYRRFAVMSTYIAAQTMLSMSLALA